ncbi:MAG: hypothetical protein ABI690_00770 [Chloroflexota bacterium]
MQIFLTRDSVAAGDDADAPHQKTITVPDDASVEEIITIVAKSNYLASIFGGKATWSANSKLPLAVVAQEWDKPKMLSYTPVTVKRLVVADGSLHLHFTYYTQLDPNIVFETLKRWGQWAWSKQDS